MVSRTFASGELPPFVSFSSGAVPLTINPGGAWTDIPLALTIASELGWSLSSDTHGLVYDEDFDSHTFGASSLTLKTGSPVLGRWTRNGNDTKPPGNGNWNQNKGNLNKLDKVHIHDTDADSVNRDALLDALQAGNRLVFEVDSGPRLGNQRSFLIDSEDDKGSWHEIEVDKGSSTQTGNVKVGDSCILFEQPPIPTTHDYEIRVSVNGVGIPSTDRVIEVGGRPTLIPLISDGLIPSGEGPYEFKFQIRQVAGSDEVTIVNYAGWQHGRWV